MEKKIITDEIKTIDETLKNLKEEKRLKLRKLLKLEALEKLNSGESFVISYDPIDEFSYQPIKLYGYIHLDNNEITGFSVDKEYEYLKFKVDIDLLSIKDIQEQGYIMSDRDIDELKDKMYHSRELKSQCYRSVVFNLYICYIPVKILEPGYIYYIFQYDYIQTIYYKDNDVYYCNYSIQPDSDILKNPDKYCIFKKEKRADNFFENHFC